MADSDVVVVGAGVGGLATAALLARVGASVTLLERASGSRPLGAGILLQPNGLAVLAGLGLAAPLLRAGHVLQRSTIRNSAARPIAETTVSDVGEEFDHLLAVRRSTLHDVLLEAVSKEPTIACRLDADVTGCTRDGEVEVRWHGRRSAITADLVVGADGVHSTVRSVNGFRARVRPTGHTYVRGLVPWDGGSIDGEYWTPFGVFGGAAVDEHTLYFYAAAARGPVADAIDAGDLVALRRLWSAVLPIAGAVLDRVQTASDLLRHDVSRVDCEPWWNGRVVLLGDAAHAMSPHLGQGANSALVDAAVLALELASPQPMADALERYFRRRSRAVRRVQDRADLMGQLSRVRHPLARAGRDAAIRRISRLRGAQRRMVRLLAQEEPMALRAAVTTLGNTRV